MSYPVLLSQLCVAARLFDLLLMQAPPHAHLLLAAKQTLSHRRSTKGCSPSLPCATTAGEEQGESRQTETERYRSLPRAAKHPQVRIVKDLLFPVPEGH